MFDFRISRASDLMEETAPVADAYQVEGRSGWFITFEDMSELMAFIRREGNIVMGEDSIIIYDDYLD